MFTHFFSTTAHICCFSILSQNPKSGCVKWQRLTKSLWALFFIIEKRFSQKTEASHVSFAAKQTQSEAVNCLNCWLWSFLSRSFQDNLEWFCFVCLSRLLALHRWNSRVTYHHHSVWLSLVFRTLPLTKYGPVPKSQGPFLERMADNGFVCWD